MYERYGVENIRQAEEYANIIRPDKSSAVYAQYNRLMNNKMNAAMKWLSDKEIEYVWNEWINGHLYRLYIPEKDVLFDFEYYPVINANYNYIRISYDSDIIAICEKIFPETILDSSDMDTYMLNQKAANKFFRENNHSPIYDKHILRLALVYSGTIYQCIIVKGNSIIANVIRRNTNIKYGTFRLLRYLNEYFEFPKIILRDNLDNSYTTSMYQLLNLTVISKSTKKKIWWSPESVKWHIEKGDSEKYIPVYFTENITYQYPPK